MDHGGGTTASGGLSRGGGAPAAMWWNIRVWEIHWDEAKLLVVLNQTMWVLTFLSAITRNRGMS